MVTVKCKECLLKNPPFITRIGYSTNNREGFGSCFSEIYCEYCFIVHKDKIFRRIKHQLKKLEKRDGVNFISVQLKKEEEKNGTYLCK